MLSPMQRNYAAKAEHGASGVGEKISLPDDTDKYGIEKHLRERKM